LHQAIAACFGDWQLLAEGGQPDTWPDGLWLPETRRMLVAPGRWVEFAFEATRFYRLPDGGRRVLAIDERPNICKGGIRLKLIGPRAHKKDLGREFAALLSRMERPHYLQGQVLKPDASILEDLQRCSWNDVALDAGVRKTVEQNTVEVLRRREQFKRHGVPLKRGVLLYGPPGTGKTLLAKVLAGQKLATFLYVTAADMARLDEVRSIFELARKLEPTIVFFEDLDLLAEDRGRWATSVLGEFLAQLDGFENNDGLIFMATTNDLEAIDPAIRERPSRFDVVLRLDLPALDARRKILARHLPAGSASDELLNEAASATDGLSGAQVREVAFLALQRAVLEEPCDAEGRLIVSRDDLLQAIVRLRGKREAPIGFGRAGKASMTPASLAGR
jgi:SpoVK/Ycf46/Vps4 family AAA+-type ATPase